MSTMFIISSVIVFIFGMAWGTILDIRERDKKHMNSIYAFIRDLDEITRLLYRETGPDDPLPSKFLKDRAVHWIRQIHYMTKNVEEVQRNVQLPHEPLSSGKSLEEVSTRCIFKK